MAKTVGNYCRHRYSFHFSMYLDPIRAPLSKHHTKMTGVGNLKPLEPNKIYLRPSYQLSVFCGFRNYKILFVRQFELFKDTNLQPGVKGWTWNGHDYSL